MYMHVVVVSQNQLSTDMFFSASQDALISSRFHRLYIVDNLHGTYLLWRIAFLV